MNARFSIHDVQRSASAPRRDQSSPVTGAWRALSDVQHTPHSVQSSIASLVYRAARCHALDVRGLVLVLLFTGCAASPPRTASLDHGAIAEWTADGAGGRASLTVRRDPRAISAPVRFAPRTPRIP